MAPHRLIHARRATNVYTNRVLDLTRRFFKRQPQVEEVLLWIEK